MATEDKGWGKAMRSSKTKTEAPVTKVKEAPKKTGDTTMSTESTAVQQELVTDLVAFSFKPGRLVIEPRDKHAVQLDNGRFTEVQVQGLQLISSGSRRQGGYVEYDPSNPEHAETIGKIDHVIETRPEFCNAPNIQLRRRDSAEVGIPGGFVRWDSASPTEIYQIMFDFNVDAKVAMQYELAKGAREDVIMAIEKAAEDRATAEADMVEEAPVL